MSEAFDYLVLGGGTAGCALAAQLTDDPSVHVALLEAGESVWSKSAQWEIATEPQPGLNGRSVATPRSKLLGGARVLQAMRTQGRTSAEPMASHFRAAMQEAGLAAEEAAAGGAELLLSPLHLARPNLRVITGAHVMRVLLEGHREQPRAVGVEYGHEGYQKQLRAAREVLLCAGALHSPQILMLSGIGPHAHLVENGIATRRDLPGVGLGLYDQPEIALRVEPARPALLGVLRGAAAWRRPVAGALAGEAAVAAGLLRSAPDASHPDLRLALTLPSGGGYALVLRLLQPESRGRVRLDSKDAFAAPLVDPNYLGDRDDLQRLLQGFRLARTLVAQPVLAALGGREAAASRQAQADLQLEHFIRDHAAPGGAPAGSCAMGDGPMDVVDAQWRVHGVKGLRVVDASVLPQTIGGDLEAPVLRMAEAAAALLRSAP